MRAARIRLAVLILLAESTAIFAAKVEVRNYGDYILNCRLNYFVTDSKAVTRWHNVQPLNRIEFSYPENVARPENVYIDFYLFVSLTQMEWFYRWRHLKGNHYYDYTYNYTAGGTARYPKVTVGILVPATGTHPTVASRADFSAHARNSILNPLMFGFVCGFLFS